MNNYENMQMKDTNYTSLNYVIMLISYMVR